MGVKEERIVLTFDVGTQSSRALLINNRGEMDRSGMIRPTFPENLTGRSRMRTFITAVSVKLRRN